MRSYIVVYTDLILRTKITFAYFNNFNICIDNNMIVGVIMKKKIAFVLSCILTAVIIINPIMVSAQAPEVSAPSVVLMEASTGQVIYEKNSNEKLPPASVTKVMTLLLIFEALEAGEIELTEEVVVSEHAASMGGSQVFLEPGERQTVDTMIKCIVISSANDACVAMGEMIAGTEGEFVARMNERARELGMDDTNFVNCNGLDAEGHLTTSYDIALMTRELITKYPEIYEYTTIWMEDIVHETAQGSSVFGLSNTNKLIKQYAYATGLKTGSTSLAKYCLSATASNGGIDMIAVIMAAPSGNDRTKDAISLLDYGFGVSQKYSDQGENIYEEIPVINGTKDTITGQSAEPFAYIDINGNDLSKVTKELMLFDDLKAPILEGDKIGEIRYKIGSEELGKVDVVAMDSVDEMSFSFAFHHIFKEFCL